MNITLNPSELQAVTEQLLAVLLPAIQKAFQSNAKVRSEVLDCLTVEAVAQRLKCDPKTVRKYIQDGKLGAANFGTWDRPVWKISEADFAEFYRSHRK